MGKKYLDIKENSLESSVYNILHGIQETVKKEKLDPVGKEDGDIDNDGDKDASDKYLAKRRKTVAKAIKKDKKEGNAFGMALKSAKEKGEKTFVVSGKTYKVEGLEDSPNTANSQHLCAKNVVHENWGNGTPISGQHAEPDADGDIAWYDVMFEHGIEKGVSINELKVTKAESHHHSEKKKKKMDEEVDLDEGTYRIGNMKKSGNFKAKNAEDAAQKILIIQYDLIVLDIMMPGKNGLEFTREYRNKINTPIILLTAKSETNERVEGLEIGADDYLPKPFEPKELILRIINILNKTKKNNEKRILEFDNIKIDLNKLLIIQNNKEFKINNTEKIILEKMMNEPGKTFSREAIGKLIDLDKERSIDVIITRLRKKIEINPKNPKYLQTLRGVGYVLWIE